MFRNNHPEARRQQQPATPHHPGGQVQEQGPGQRRDIPIDWADRLIHPQRDARLNGKWEGLKGNVAAIAPLSSNETQGCAAPSPSSLPLMASPSWRPSRRRGSRLSFACLAVFLLPFGVCGGLHRSSISIRRQRAPSSRSGQQANGCTTCAGAVRVFISPVQLMQPHQALHLATNFSA
jgi:hypothetical protein